MVCTNFYCRRKKQPEVSVGSTVHEPWIVELVQDILSDGVAIRIGATISKSVPMNTCIRLKN